jgi:hypothetical protein
VLLLYARCTIWSNTWLFNIAKKKPPAKAVVEEIALAGFIKRPQLDLNQR